MSKPKWNKENLERYYKETGGELYALPSEYAWSIMKNNSCWNELIEKMEKNKLYTYGPLQSYLKQTKDFIFKLKLEELLNDE